MKQWTKNLLLFALSLMIAVFSPVFTNPPGGNAVWAESPTLTPALPGYTPCIALDENAEVRTTNPAPTPIQTTLPNSSVGITRLKPTSHPISGNIKVQAYNFIRCAITNMITPRFKLCNTGSRPIKLSTVKIRYYYTVDGIKPQDFLCPVSSVGPGNITGTFVKMPAAGTGANYYLEIGFSGDAGDLAAGAGIDIHTRIAKAGDSEYRQRNDYSFNSAATGYMDWNKATGYISGVLKWGKEP
jgi:hypothetical protein